MFKAEITCVPADETNELTPSMPRILTEIHGEMMELEQRIAAMNHEIEAIAALSDTARRLMTVPGIGPLASTVLLAAAGSSRQFRKARDPAAWLGLAPTAAHSQEAGYICADRHRQHRSTLARTGRVIHFLPADPSAQPDPASHRSADA